MVELAHYKAVNLVRLAGCVVDDSRKIRTPLTKSDNIILSNVSFL